MPDDQILSVTALTTAIRLQLENAFPFVWVRGQVTNLSRPSSGHLYFSLRDDACSLAAVWFKGNQKAGEHFDPLTGEVYEDSPRPSLALSLENGQEIICAGRVAVYGARGQYQLLVEIAQQAGLGRLHEEFERLRAKLEAQGYFAPERKRPLPPQPRRVAVVTAPQGAALQDFLRIAQSRGLASVIRIYPVPVQGEGAPPKIIAALDRIAREGWAEVVVVIRGGGSLEDLWAFNNEALATAIFTSPLPVLAGIGHEVDHTLADMTADARAATPTHAAQLLWPSREELTRRWRLLSEALRLSTTRAMENRELALAGLERDLEWRSPLRLMQNREQSLLNLSRLLRHAAQRRLEREEHRLDLCRAALTRATLGLPEHENTLARLARSLYQAGKALTSTPQHALNLLQVRLEAANPTAPLARGFALLVRPDGGLVTSASSAAPGDALRALLHDGELGVRVEERLLVENAPGTKGQPPPP
jgi:exodeoxyribonuclease VII large subunit